MSYPAINPIEEMVNLMGAARSYEVNIAAVQATKNMISNSLEIFSEPEVSDGQSDLRDFSAWPGYSRSRD